MTTRIGSSTAGLRASGTASDSTRTTWTPCGPAFREAVEDYIETCTRIGKTPQKPYSGRMMFRVDPEVHRRAALAAELAGKSLNQWAEEVLERAAR